MPFYMENLLGQADGITGRHTLALTYPADQPLPMIATQDIAAAAAGLLRERSWTGTQNLPVFGPDRLTPHEIAQTIGDVLGHEVSYHQLSLDDVRAAVTARGASERVAQEMVEMMAAQSDGICDADWALATPYPTGLRSWCEQVLRPALSVSG